MMSRKGQLSRPVSFSFFSVIIAFFLLNGCTALIVDKGGKTGKDFEYQYGGNTYCCFSSKKEAEQQALLTHKEFVPKHPLINSGAIPLFFKYETIVQTARQSPNAQGTQQTSVQQDISSTGNTTTQQPLAQTACNMMINGQCDPTTATGLAAVVGVAVIGGITAGVVTAVNNEAQRQQQQQQNNNNLMTILAIQNAQSATPAPTPPCVPSLANNYTCP